MPRKIQAILQMDKPGNTTEVRRFLGMVNQMRNYISNVAQKSEPLRVLLSSKTTWDWRHMKEQAFIQISENFSHSPT